MRSIDYWVARHGNEDLIKSIPANGSWTAKERGLTGNDIHFLKNNGMIHLIRRRKDGAREWETTARFKAWQATVKP